MYNTDIPTRAELPTSRQLIRSTITALLLAGLILVTIVLPAEYALDPTGIGRVLGLAEMGEIKTQLAEEAERDRARDAERIDPGSPAKTEQVSGLDVISALLLIRPAAAQNPQNPPDAQSDEVAVTLKPGEGTEIKLVMKQGAKVAFSWTVSGGVVNFDLHGDGGGRSKSYEKGRAVPGHTGVLEAAFDGNHGWFWRNRGRSDVTVTLRARGSYTEVKRLP